MAQTLPSKPLTILLNLLQRKALRASISFTGLNQLRDFFASGGDDGSEGEKPFDCDTSNDAKFYVENMVVDKLSDHTTEIAHKDFKLNHYLTTIDDKFSVLLKAKDWTAAHEFLFNCKGHNKSEITLFECFVGGLCSHGKISEAFDVIRRMKGIGLQPTLSICNSILMASLRMGRTDQVWQVYKDMTESDLNFNIQTFGFLIQALCKENRLDEAYDLLHEVLNMGLEVPDVVTFRELIAGFCKAGCRG